MISKALIVVSDKFSKFTMGKQAVTESQLHAMLALPEHILPGRTCLVPGQGLSETKLAALITMIEAADPHGKRWDASPLRELPDRAGSMLSHKHEPANTLISRPEQTGEGSYRLDMCIDQNCELMGDHQTGQHVQGMILVEAARQSFLAVSEAFYPHPAGGKTYFVIHTLSTDFVGFVFPLHAHIDYRVLAFDENERRQKFKVETDFVQNGEIRTRVAFSFTVYPHDVIAEKEASLADVAFQAAMNRAAARTVLPLGRVA